MEANKREKQIDKIKNQKLFSVLIGAISGFINGLFGAGGGMIVVPMLINLLKFKTKQAHATAILIILPLSLVSGLLYLSFGNFNVNVGVPTSIGVILGGILGAILLSKISSKWVGVIFSVLMAVAGVKMMLF
ncbi:MAG: sulfite exporter TauE/SafE family protein [Clostridiales bacterium]|nr:sulfite exporter TauE/SafE family protein [Clostridiales bacterium]